MRNSQDDEAQAETRTPNRRHPLTPNDTRGVYLLFFDGGSRGNPGPGGTGSIIVRVHKDSHTASLIWAASMAYSRKDTTNNFAEYWCLIHGLREAQRSHFEPLYVIGDSALIISNSECIGPLDSTDWHVYTRQVDESGLHRTPEDGTITTGLQQRWRTQRQPSHGTPEPQRMFTSQLKRAFQQSHQDLDNDGRQWLMRNVGRPKSVDKHKADLT
ncbi:reverse transcriptase, partial [Globisporangium splendens]